MLDLLIKNGTVIDGSGDRGFHADVAMEKGTIRIVGDGGSAEATTIIDATGRVVCPGFIDMHAHSDIALLVNPRQESKIMQGVTTEVIGQDGLSYAPVSASTLSALRTNLAALNGDSADLSWDWTTVGDFLTRFDGKTAVNVCYLVPHAAVRLLVVGAGNRKATGSELQRMKDIVAEGMSEGAVGFSTGLTYTPCAFSDTEELIACCQGISRSGVFFAPHLRSYGAYFREAIDEALNVARRSGVPLHFTHFHSSFEINKDHAENLLACLDQAQREGIEITLDSYPYTSASSFLAGFSPPGPMQADRVDFLPGFRRANSAKECAGNLKKKAAMGTVTFRSNGTRSSSAESLAKRIYRLLAAQWLKWHVKSTKAHLTLFAISLSRRTSEFPVWR